MVSGCTETTCIETVLMPLLTALATESRDLVKKIMDVLVGFFGILPHLKILQFRLSQIR